MSWDQHHSESEKLAISAGMAAREGNIAQAESLYRRAAEEEAAAFEGLAEGKERTRGVTAVSAVALWYKSKDYASAESQAYRYLSTGLIPGFAQAQLRNLLTSVWTARAGVKFIPGDVLVSVSGGQIIHGGAPLDLILERVEHIKAALFRTVEMLLHRPFRQHGGPSADILSMLRPWLLQAPAGSYQFAVRIQEPAQGELWNTERPKVEGVTAEFFRILRASVADPEVELAAVVPNTEYRSAFLNLSRNLAPTGKTFEMLEVRDPSAPGEPVISLAASTRQDLNAALRKIRPPRATAGMEEPAQVVGVLRAVHLDKDWLEVTTADNAHVHIIEAGDALDDVVGPMVNRRVVVETVRRGSTHLYRDIQLEE